jgi:DNA (cytosine-5)-methyltransferase 1
MGGILRAIDLFSGVGGWSLGLRMAGIKVVASYDIHKPACETNFENNRHKVFTEDLRSAPVTLFPTDVDLVVGSPPCTQFSFSNRGGSGDIDDGLRDVITFLKVVDHLRPRAWAMENVPRIAAIIEKECRRGGKLAKFSHLGIEAHVVNMEDFGLPQRRKRCIAGNFNFELLRSYVKNLPRKTLGEVVEALSLPSVVDPIYGIVAQQSELNDHVLEDFLDQEEERINRANKTNHPIYNRMPFPDPLDRSVRTVTATCTRVGRESIIIQDPHSPGGFRRLTIRERATLQGFPISFEFYSESYGRKLTMIGNAMPPLFAYYLGQAFREVEPRRVRAPLLTRQFAPRRNPPVTPPSSAAKRFAPDRTFRFAIPSLHAKSGVRFELANKTHGGKIEWAVAFYFGTSKSIRSITLDNALRLKLLQLVQRWRVPGIRAELESFDGFMATADVTNMQRVWSHRGPGATRPFMVLDRLSQSGNRIRKLFAKHNDEAEAAVAKVIEGQYGHGKRMIGTDKLIRNAPLILAGLLLGSSCNAYLPKRPQRISSRVKSVRSMRARN